MQWIIQHSDAIATIAILGGFFGWTKKQLRLEFDKKFDSIEKKIDEIQTDVKSINQRLTRLEGRFEERGYWESRIVIRKEIEERQPETIPAVPIEMKRRRVRRKTSNQTDTT